VIRSPWRLRPERDDSSKRTPGMAIAWPGDVARCLRKLFGASLLVVVCSGSGCTCGPSISGEGCGPVDLEGSNACAAAGGICGTCGYGQRADPSMSCPGLLESCCVTTELCEENGGECSVTGCGAATRIAGSCAAANAVCCAARDSAAMAGLCNGAPCFAGCRCERADGGGGLCDCPVTGDSGADAVSDAAHDAGDAGDAGIVADAADAGPPADAADAATDAAATDASPIPTPCGIILCVFPCICVSVQASDCFCP